MRQTDLVPEEEVLRLTLPPPPPLPFRSPRKNMRQTDLVSEEEVQRLTSWLRENTRAAAVLPAAAIRGEAGVAGVLEWVAANLPLGPSLYRQGRTPARCRFRMRSLVAFLQVLARPVA